MVLTTELCLLCLCVWNCSLLACFLYASSSSSSFFFLLPFFAALSSEWCWFVYIYCCCYLTIFSTKIKHTSYSRTKSQSSNVYTSQTATSSHVLQKKCTIKTASCIDDDSANWLASLVLLFKTLLIQLLFVLYLSWILSFRKNTRPREERNSCIYHDLTLNESRSLPILINCKRENTRFFIMDWLPAS